MKTNKVVLWLFASFFTTAFVVAQPSSNPPQGITRVTSIEGVTEFRLQNGLRVLLVPDASSQRVTVNITYLVGSRNESYGETGMAHLLEHLMFKGSPGHPNIPDELTKHGASPNGTTNEDRTNYFETFSSTDENMEWALDLEADRMVHSYIAKKDLDSEMTVVRNELERGENSPVRILDERVMETAYLWHNYGHPTIGARSDVEGVPIERLQVFYQQYYQPDNAVLIIAGKFDEGKTLGLIQKKFGSIPKPTRVLLQPYTQEPTQDGMREVTLRRVGDVQAVIAAYHIPAAGNADTVALDALCYILSDHATGRLHKELVETKLATTAGASVSEQHDPGMLRVMAQVPKGGDLGAVRAKIIQIIEGIQKQPVTQKEVDTAKSVGAQGFERMMGDGNQLEAALSEAAAQGDWRLLFWERDVLKKLTVDDIQKAAAKYLVESNLTVGEFIPDAKPVRADIPAVSDYTEVLKDYRGGATVNAGEQFDSSPANIEVRTSRTSIGSIKLALLPKQSRGHQVTVVMNIHFGNEEALRNKRVAGNVTAQMLMRGTEKHDLQQLRDAMIALKSEISLGGGADGVLVRIRTDREHLTGALKLAAEVLKMPSFPDKAFDEIKLQHIASLEASRTDPASVAGLELRRELSPYPEDHVYYTPTLDQSIQSMKALDIADLKRFYKEFYGIGAAEIAFVGDFDPKEATEDTQEFFSEWKSPVPYVRIPHLYKEVEADSKQFSIPDKQNASFAAETNIKMRDDNPAYPALVLGNFMIGGGFLNSRLATRIRQKDGLSYHVGSSFYASSFDQSGTFSVSAICAPQNEGKVEKAVDEELAKVLDSGFTPEEVANAKSGYLQARALGRSSDHALATSLTQYLYEGRDFHWDEQYEQHIAALTPEDIHRALKEFIDPKRIVRVSAGDFTKAAN